jgi:U11/U12 small nuclear ribonucleoprotein 65 kDa protein
LSFYRLRFLGKVLIVERASKITKNGQDETTKGKASASKPMQSDVSIKQNELKSGSEPIAPTLGVDYPFPPHLE